MAQMHIYLCLNKAIWADTFTIRKPFQNENIIFKGEETTTRRCCSKRTSELKSRAIAVNTAYGYSGVKVIKQPKHRYSIT